MPKAKSASNLVTRGQQTLSFDVKEIILQWIRQGKYPPGSHLPSVPELVAKLSVSRTVIREALQMLAGMNVLEMKQGLGCFIRSVPAELIVNADVMAALIDMETLIQVAIARKAIEGTIARLAAVEATETDFLEIETTLSRIAIMAKKNQPMYSVTPEFHVAVAKATHNRVLEGVVSSLNELMTAAGHVIERETKDPNYRVNEYESHAALLRILKKKNPQQAQEAMEAHVQLTVDALQETFARTKAR